jgi:F5/8 type C domain/Bacterial Ig domain
LGKLPYTYDWMSTQRCALRVVLMILILSSLGYSINASAFASLKPSSIDNKYDIPIGMPTVTGTATTDLSSINTNANLQDTPHLPEELNLIEGNASTLATCEKLPVTSVTAIGNDGNIPSNAIDNNLNTRWSNNGVGSWIQLDLGSKRTICSVDIAWYRGDMRVNNFEISVFNDAKSSGTTTSSEKYDMPAGTEGRYVRINVNGNTENNWASITEIAVFGSAAPIQPGTNHPPTADSKSVSTDTSTPVDIKLTGKDPENSPLTYVVADNPKNGKVALVAGSADTVRYTPNTGFTGSDSFTYTAKDNKGAVSNKATVNLTVLTPGGPNPPPPPPPPPPTSTDFPYTFVGSPQDMEDEGWGERNYASGKPSDITHEWSGETSAQNYAIIIDVTLTEIDHDDTISFKFGGTHMGSGWYDNTYSFESGQACIGKEEDHPSTDLCVVTGRSIGSLVNTPVKLAAVNIGKGEKLEMYSNLGSGWTKDVESSNGVDGFRPQVDEDEAVIRIDAAPGIEMRSAQIVELDPASTNPTTIISSPPSDRMVITEDDGWTEGEYAGTPDEQNEQARQDWEAAGRPGDRYAGLPTP